MPLHFFNERSAIVRASKRMFMEMFAILLALIPAMLVGGFLLGGLGGDGPPVFFFLAWPFFYWLLRAWLCDITGFRTRSADEARAHQSQATPRASE